MIKFRGKLSTRYNTFGFKESLIPPEKIDKLMTINILQKFRNSFKGTNIITQKVVTTMFGFNLELTVHT